MTDINPEAIEKAAAAGWDRSNYSRTEIATMCLEAALPALRAQIVRELADEARAEYREAWKRGMAAGIDTPEEAAADADGEHAHNAHRWLSARTETKENQ